MKDFKQDYNPLDIEKNKVVAGLGYIFFAIPLLADSKSPFNRYHANQSLVLLILYMVVNAAISLLVGLLGWIPIIGTILAFILSIVSLVAGIGMFTLVVIGLVSTVNGSAKQLPIVGYTRLIK